MTEFAAVDRLVNTAVAAPDSGTTTPPTAADQEKIRDLAAQFESLLISQLLKDMQASMAGEEKGEDGFDASPLGDAMNAEFGLALSRAGGFGVGEALSNAMARQVSPNASTDGVETDLRNGELKNPPGWPITPVSPMILPGAKKP